MKQHFFLFILTLTVSSICATMSFTDRIQQKPSSDPKLANVCVGGKDPSKMQPKKYLEEFNKGPCSPILTVPAMTAQRLVVDFVCDEARKNYSEVWSKCGWIQPCWNNKKSIQIWPPDYNFAATFVLNREQFKDCITTLLGPQVSLDDNIPHYYSKPGMSVRPQWEGAYNFGHVERKESCGYRASNKIVNGPFGIEKFQAQYLAEYWDEFKYLGYRSNLSTFMFAYDWRKDPQTNVKDMKFKEMAELLFNLTGKKITVITHSYGVNTGYQGLLQFDKKRRSEIFGDFLSVMGPWLGTYMPFDYLLGGDFLAGAVEIPKATSDQTMTNMGVVYTLTMKDTFIRFKNESWIKKTLQARDYYQDGKGTKPFSWLPNREAICDEDSRKVYQTEKIGDTPVPGAKIYLACDFGISEPTTLTKVAGKTWTLSQTEEFIRQHSVANKDKNAKLFKNFNTYNESKFDSLGVRVYFVVQNNVQTQYQQEYTKWDSKDPTIVDQSSAKKIMGSGDGTVNFVSQLGPAFKWAEEFETSPKDQRPVKIIHYCNDLGARISQKYQHDPLFDQKLKNNENAYLGIPCKCSSQQFFDEQREGKADINSTCNHSAAFNDDSQHYLIGKVLVNSSSENAYYRVYNGLTPFAKSQDEKYLKDMLDHCMLEKPWFLEAYQKNFQTKDASFLKLDSANWRRLNKKRILNQPKF